MPPAPKGGGIKKTYHAEASQLSNPTPLLHMFSYIIWTHLGLKKMVSILQMTFANSFSWITMIEFRHKNHWNIFPKHVIIDSINGLAPNWYLNQWWPRSLMQNRKYASPGDRLSECHIIFKYLQYLINNQQHFFSPCKHVSIELHSSDLYTVI